MVSVLGSVAEIFYLYITPHINQKINLNSRVPVLSRRFPLILPRFVIDCNFVWRIVGAVLHENRDTRAGNKTSRTPKFPARTNPRDAYLPSPFNQPLKLATFWYFFIFLKFFIFITQSPVPQKSPVIPPCLKRYHTPLKIVETCSEFG